MAVRLPSDKEAVVLEELIKATQRKKGAMLFGLELVRRRPDELSRTTIYMILTRLVAKGMVATRLETDEEQEGRGPKVRLYQVTEYGAKMYAASRDLGRMTASALKLKPVGTMD